MINAVKVELLGPHLAGNYMIGRQGRNFKRQCGRMLEVFAEYALVVYNCAVFQERTRLIFLFLPLSRAIYGYQGEEDTNFRDGTLSGSCASRLNSHYDLGGMCETCLFSKE